MLTQERRKQLEKNIEWFGWVGRRDLTNYRALLVDVVDGEAEDLSAHNAPEYLEAVEGMLERRR